jgi:arsenate reductase
MVLSSVHRDLAESIILVKLRAWAWPNAKDRSTTKDILAIIFLKYRGIIRVFFIGRKYMSALIYHNPRCSKSRATLAILEEKGVNFKVINYLENPPTLAELKGLLVDLGIDARSLMRKGENAYKENNLSDSALTEDELLVAMLENPILIERPIVSTKNGAVLGRPPENILAII